MGRTAFVLVVLATVVVGGAVTATLLTLFILPTLYSLLGKKISKIGSFINWVTDSIF